VEQKISVYKPTFRLVLYSGPMIWSGAVPCAISVPWASCGLRNEFQVARLIKFAKCLQFTRKKTQFDLSF